MKQNKQQDPIDKRVPKANFIENIPDACRKEGAQNILALLDQQHNKYKLIESQLQRSYQSTNSKIPQIQKTLQMIDSLKIQNNPEVDFMLSDGVFVKAKARQGSEKVALWLGANTIVQLSHKEAQKLLQQNLKNARTSSKQISEELEYIRDQRTTTEVNIARVYNHSLVEKRQQQMKAAEKAKEEDD